MKRWFIYLIVGALSTFVRHQAWPMEGDNHGNHGPLKDWFNHLASKKGLCCSFADGFSVTDVDWDTGIGPDGKEHFKVKLPAFIGNTYGDGRQITVPATEDYVWVPDDAVVPGPNRYGPAVVWPTLGNQGETIIRCFMPGAGT